MSEAATQAGAQAGYSVWVQAWSIPEAAVVGEKFSLKVGAKASDERDLAGAGIEICDAAGAVLASEKLQALPWPDTTALYWTDLTLQAPAVVGLSEWTARFATTLADAPEECRACVICLATVAPPAHVMKITVVEKESGAPIEDAVVRWGAFRAATDATGQAELKLPRGSQPLIVWKAGFEVPVAPCAIDDDVVLVIEASVIPEENPDDAWKM